MGGDIFPYVNLHSRKVHVSNISVLSQQNSTRPIFILFFYAHSRGVKTGTVPAHIFVCLFGTKQSFEKNHHPLRGLLL